MLSLSAVTNRMAPMISVSGTAERAVKSFGFSVLLSFVWCFLSRSHVRSLLHDFRWMELVWVIYNLTLAVLFLIRSRPTAISLNPLHWVVALVTSFSGMFFQRIDVADDRLRAVGDSVVLVGLVMSGASAVALGRSYDVFPALRSVATRSLYRVVRHPMYLASIVMRLGYMVGNVSAYNVAVFAGMVLLYTKRAAFEEAILRNDARYAAYLDRVRFRFVPFVY